jgi:ABC-2 type transport system permease protein
VLTTRRHPLWQLLLARLREFYREPAVLFWVYGFPLFLAVGLGFAFSHGQTDISQVDILQTQEVDVQDTQDKQEAITLRDHLRSQGLLTRLETAATCRERLRAGKAALCIVPEADGYRYEYDPDRPGSLLARYRVDDIVQRWKASRTFWKTTDVLLQEPGSRYIDFLIPGLMGLNLMGGGLWGVGFVIVDLRVRKLLKRFLATPMRPRSFLLSILLSRLIFLVPEMLLLLLAGWLLFGVSVRGSLGGLIVVIIVGGAAFAGLGLLLGCRTEKTETVSGLINLLVIPMWMLCGTFFPTQRFPAVLQPAINVLPLSQLNDALRAIILEGAPLMSVMGPVAALLAWAFVSFVAALSWFRWR